MKNLLEMLTAYKKDNNGDHLLLSKIDVLIAVANKLENMSEVNKIDEIAILSEAQTGYSEYRIMNDCESDNRTLWIEYKAGQFRLTSGDWLLKMR